MTAMNFANLRIERGATSATTGVFRGNGEPVTDPGELKDWWDKLNKKADREAEIAKMGHRVTTKADLIAALADFPDDAEVGVKAACCHHVHGDVQVRAATELDDADGIVIQIR